MNVDKLKQEGWSYSTSLKDGIKSTYQWYLKNNNSYKQVKL